MTDALPLFRGARGFRAFRFARLSRFRCTSLPAQNDNRAWAEHRPGGPGAVAVHVAGGFSDEGRAFAGVLRAAHRPVRRRAAPTTLVRCFAHVHVGVVVVVVVVVAACGGDLCELLPHGYQSAVVLNTR